MKSKPIAKIVLATNFSKENTAGEKVFPLKIRVTCNRTSKYYKAKTLDCFTNEEFSRGRTKTVKDAICLADECLREAERLIDMLGGDFTWERFGEAYNDWYVNGDRTSSAVTPSERALAKSMTSPRFSDILQTYLSVADLSQSSIDIYSITGRWIERYRPGVKITDIDEDFLTGFKKFVRAEHLKDPKCKGREISENTLRMYLRDIKAIINYSIKKGLHDGKNPFTSMTGQPLTSIPRQKAAMKEDDFWKLIDYVPQTKDEEFGKDFFLASIQLSGANLGDILRLRNGDIADGEVNYIRRKSRRSGIITSPPLTPGFLDFLLKYGCVNRAAPDSLILPFLTGLDTEKKIKQRIKWVNLRINKGLHSICSKLGIRDMTVYNARHTFASYAVSNGLSIEAIQRFLGHSNVKTTQVYISSITDTEKDRDRTFLNTLNKKAPQR